MAVYEHVLRVTTGDSTDNTQRLADTIDKLNDKLENLGRKSQGTGERVRKVADEAEVLGRRAGDTATNAGKLAGILDIVDPKLGELARFAADAGDALEVASIGGASLFRVLGPLVAVVGAGALMYANLKMKLDEANKAMETAKQRAEDMVDVHKKVREAALLAALATGELTQEEYNRIASVRSAKDLFRQQDEDARERLKTSKQELDTLQQQLAAARAAFIEQRQRSSSGQVTAGEGGILAGTAQPTSAGQAQFLEQQIASLTDAINTQKVVVDAATTSVENLGQAQSRFATDLETAQNAPLRAAAALEAQKDAARATAEALRDLTRDLAALAFMYDALPRDGRLEALRQQVSAFGPAPQALDPRAQAGLLRADLAVASSQGRLGAAELADLERAVDAGLRAGLQEATAAQLQSAQAMAESAAAQRESAAAQREAAVQAVGAALTGDPTALLSLAGGGLSNLGFSAASKFGGTGAGAAGVLGMSAGAGLSAVAGPVGTALSALAGIGEAGGAAGVKQQAMAFKDAVISGIEALPEIIVEVIPAFIKALVTELPIAIIRALGELLERLLARIFPRLFGGGGGGGGTASGPIGENSAIQGRDDTLEIASSAVPGKAGQASVDPLASRTRSARSLRLSASLQAALASSRRQQAAFSSAVIAPTFQALSVDDRFMVDATTQMSRLTDPATGLRRRTA